MNIMKFKITNHPSSENITEHPTKARNALFCDAYRKRSRCFYGDLDHSYEEAKLQECNTHGVYYGTQPRSTQAYGTHPHSTPGGTRRLEHIEMATTTTAPPPSPSPSLHCDNANKAYATMTIMNRKPGLCSRALDIRAPAMDSSNIKDTRNGIVTESAQFKQVTNVNKANENRELILFDR